MTEGRRGKAGGEWEPATAGKAKRGGPTSAEGKAKSAQNSKKHGLTSSVLEVSEAEISEISELLAKLRERYDINQPEQAVLVERVIISSVQLARARRLITEAVEDLAFPHNARRAEKNAEGVEYVRLVTSILKDEYGASKLGSIPRLLAKQAGYFARTPTPYKSGLPRLLVYAQRFRGQRDRALRRLEAIARKPA